MAKRRHVEPAGRDRQLCAGGEPAVRHRLDCAHRHRQRQRAGDHGRWADRRAGRPDGHHGGRVELLPTDPADGFSAEYRVDLPAAVASETVTASVSTSWALVIAAFKASASSARRCVLDPGFYYFNGLGFGGGGGASASTVGRCWPGTRRGIVGQAGFSSGDCTPGGGAACASPASSARRRAPVSVCPPNVAADPPANDTWLQRPATRHRQATRSQSRVGLVHRRRPRVLERVDLGARRQHRAVHDRGRVSEALAARLGLLARHLYGHRERDVHHRRDGLLREAFRSRRRRRGDSVGGVLRGGHGPRGGGFSSNSCGF